MQNLGTSELTELNGLMEPVNRKRRWWRPSVKLALVLLLGAGFSLPWIISLHNKRQLVNEIESLNGMALSKYVRSVVIRRKPGGLKTPARTCLVL